MKSVISDNFTIIKETTAAFNWWFNWFLLLIKCLQNTNLTLYPVEREREIHMFLILWNFLRYLGNVFFDINECKQKTEHIKTDASLYKKKNKLVSDVYKNIVEPLEYK